MNELRPLDKVGQVIKLLRPIFEPRRGGESMNSGKQGSRIPGYPYPSDIDEIGERMDLTRGEVDVMRAFQQGMRQDNRVCFFSQETMGKKIRCHRRTVMRAVQTLEEKGLLQVDRSRKFNQYRFVFPWPTVRGDKVSLSSGDKKSHEEGRVTEDHINKIMTRSETRVLRVRNKQTNEQKTDTEIEITAKAENDEGVLGKIPTFPEPMDEDSINKLYSPGYPPPWVDLTKPQGKRFSIVECVRPFFGAEVGRKFDSLCHRLFEQQANDFIDSVLRVNWNGKKTEPGMPIIQAMRRAARAGVLHKLGFKPKYEDELRREEEERIRREKAAEEARIRQREEEERIRREEEARIAGEEIRKEKERIRRAEEAEEAKRNRTEFARKDEEVKKLLKQTEPLRSYMIHKGVCVYDDQSNEYTYFPEKAMKILDDLQTEHHSMQGIEEFCIHQIAYSERVYFGEADYQDLLIEGSSFKLQNS